MLNQLISFKKTWLIDHLQARRPSGCKLLDSKLKQQWSSFMFNFITWPAICTQSVTILNINCLSESTYNMLYFPVGLHGAIEVDLIIVFFRIWISLSLGEGGGVVAFFPTFWCFFIVLLVLFSVIKFDGTTSLHLLFIEVLVYLMSIIPLFIQNYDNRNRLLGYCIEKLER